MEAHIDVSPCDWQLGIKYGSNVGHSNEVYHRKLRRWDNSSC